MLISLRALRERLSGGQIAGLIALSLLATLLSYAGWRINRHEWVRQEQPRWVFDDHVLYDGYGNYAHALNYLMLHPTEENRANIKLFLVDHQHASRFVYPLMVAVVALPTENILWSAVGVTVVFSFLALLAFLRIAADHFDCRGRDLFWIGALFMSHIGIMGSWTRAMADSTALFFLLCIFYWSIEAARRPTVKSLAALAIFLTLGTLSKEAIVMSAALLPAAWLGMWAKTPKRAAIAAGGCFLVGVAGLATLWALSETLAQTSWAGGRFVAKALGTLNQVFTEGWAQYALKAGVLVFLLAFQAYPIFLLVGRREERLRFDWRDPRWMVPLAWIAAYAAQRLLFSSYHPEHSRARYGAPWVPAILLLAYPGIATLAGRYPWARWIAPALVAANLGVWILYHAALWVSQL